MNNAAGTFTKGLMIALLMTISVIGHAQVKPNTAVPLPVAPQDTIPAEILVNEDGDSVRFVSKLRTLRQVAGAPAAFYTYFWELGDGTFSFDKTPAHLYKDTGTYQVRLYATNNYDDGKAPPTRPRPIKVNKKSSRTGYWASHFFHEKGSIEMKINRNPKPGEDFVALIGYRNQSAKAQGGSLVLFFNERQFNTEGFKLNDTRAYHGEDSSSVNTLLADLAEKEMSSMAYRSGPDNGLYYAYAGDARNMLQQLQATYTRNTALRFGAMEQGTEQFVFVTMNTLPEMIQDTNATVTMSAMLVPDNPDAQPELYELEMQIVASHDPNRMQLKQRRINYRFMGKKKELTYKVRFQNTGEGPAKKVAIGIALPRQLNAQTIAIKSMSPVCVLCDSAYSGQSCIDTVRKDDSVYFVFNNIYLPGLQQDGVTDKDSTKGFIEYTIRFKKKPKKIPFSSSAAIIFDKNEPIYTNRAVGRFVKGISPGIVAGYNIALSDGLKTAHGPVQLGVTLGPFSPDKPYFQVEAYAGLFQQEKSSTGFIEEKRDTVVNNRTYLIRGREVVTTKQSNLLQVVPLHYRYNFNKWIGIGVGAQVQLSVSEQKKQKQTVFLANAQEPNITIATAEYENKSAARWLADWNAAPFADLQVGRVRSGPAVGIRYLYQLRGDASNRFFVYGIFRL
ncbi:MAG: PKD domain-containing protein [Chitinophagaceae bacterium]